MSAAITVADEILNPKYKNLESEYFYIMQDIRNLWNFNSSSSLHAKNLKTIEMNVNTLKRSNNNLLKDYLQRIPPYMAKLNAQLRHLGASVLEKYN